MKYFNVRQLDQTDCAAACLASVCFYYGKGFEIKFRWTPKWYNPFKGLDLSIGWK